MVDDGSTDRSAAIAAEFAHGDDRFRLISQPNRGLGNARNAGAGAARGEYLAFVDSDDVLPPDAYERLLAALSRTGSDFATGNVFRLTGTSTTQAPFLARTFAQTRLRTHVTRFRPLLGDRTAWNKLWRRSFWDEHRFRFPERATYEDTPLTIPAHFLARSVDVIAEPVYYWRIREASITHRRAETAVLLDRLAAVEEVSAFLAEHGPRGARAWYLERLVGDDLRLHLNVLDEGDAEYREIFLDRVNALLDGADVRIYAPLPAIDRLKWHLARRRATPELLAVLRFEREELARTPPVRVRGRWYGDYPYRTDRRLAIPRSVYRLGRQDAHFGLTAHVDAVVRDGAAVAVRGRAHVEAIGAPDAGTQRVTLTAVRPGRWQRLRARLAATRMPTDAVQRPDLDPSLTWSGFKARIDPARLRGDGVWELGLQVRARGLRRRRSRFVVDAPRAESAVDVADGDRMLRVAATTFGRVRVTGSTRWMTVSAVRPDGDALELAGCLRLSGDVPELELRRESDSLAFRCPVEVDGERFTVRVPLEPLGDGADGVWELWAVAAGRRTALSCADGVALTRARHGGAALPARGVGGGVAERQLRL
jgi:CDP-glycerol glycerophosphotransferase